METNNLFLKCTSILLVMLVIFTYMPAAMAQDVNRALPPGVLGAKEQHETLDQQQLEHRYYYFETKHDFLGFIIQDDYVFEQTFTPSLPKVTKIRLHLVAYYNPEYPIVFSIKDQAGTPLTTQTISADDIPLHGQDRLTTIDIPDLNVIPEETYIISVHCPDFPGHEHWEEEGGYTWVFGEQTFYERGTANIDIIDADFLFETYGWI